MDGVTTTEDGFTRRKNGAAAQDTSDQEKTGTCLKTLHSKQVVSPSQRNIPVYVYLLHFRQHLFLT